jgi:hypothetical protein
MYFAFGGVQLAAPWPLPLPFWLGGEMPARTVEVQAGEGTPPDLPPDGYVHCWPRASATPFLQVARVRDGFLLRFDRLADFVVSNDGSEVRFWPAAGSNDETLRHLTLDQVLPRVLTHLGRHVVHAAAVEVARRGIAFLGETGRGKSTLTASFRAAGYALLSDDGVLVHERGTDVLVEATYPSLRLWPDTLAGVLGSDQGVSPMAHYSTKRRLTGLVDRHPSEPVTLAAIYRLDGEPTGSSNVEILPVPPKDAAMALISNTFKLDVVDRTQAQQLLQFYAHVAERVPAYSLRLRRGFERLDDVRQALLEHLITVPVST